MTTEADEMQAPDEEYKWGFSKPENYIFKSRKGLSHEIIEEISEMKGEPQWMRDFRHKSLDIFLAKPMPTWGGDLSGIDFDDIYYYIKPTQEAGRTWDDLPTEIRDTFNALGIPQAEQKYLAGVGAQYECLSGDSRVYTARGLVPIREIQAGDTVFSFDEEAGKIIPAKVRATAEKGEREVFEVKVGTRRIKATANHPFLALTYTKAEDRQRGRYTREWKYLEDLSVGDLVAVTKTLPETGAEYTLQQSAIRMQTVGGSQTLTLPRPEEVVHLPDFAGVEEIEAITPAGVEMVYDIEVDGPHNFVAEGLIVHNSEVIYHKVREDLEKLGVIFVDPNTAFREHEELFRPYFSTVIPPNDNKFAALNSAVWSGGSFIYIPKGVKVEIPLQAYFRINAKNMGQFERTLIIADEDSYVHYVEGCFTAGARVRTRDGEKLIEDIREGDEVFTHKGRHRRVYHTMQRPYKGTLYHVRFFGDSWRELHITEEHPLLVTRRQKAEYRNETYKPEWLPASEVKPGDYLMIPVPQPEKVTDVGHTITIPLGRGRHEPIQREVTLPLEEDFFRLVGYYHAEGHVDNEHYLSFSFHVEETELLDDTRDLIERYFAKAPIENKPRQNGQTLVLSSTEAARAFARTFGSTVYDKRVPDFIRNAPKTHLAQWVRGIWLGDGSYDARKNMFRYNTVSQELAYAFRDALLRLNIAASVNVQERKSPRRPMYVVVISSPWNEQFGEIVGYPAPGGTKEGSPFALDEQYLYMPIRSIEIEEVDTTVYNFSVEEDESYVAEGVVSHNCTAPTYTTDSLHSAVVEIIVKKNARVRYTTIQNWSKNVYNLVTKRAMAYENATMEWVDGNLGCLIEGSTVTTPTGVKAIEALEVGEQVLSYDEGAGELCFRPVTAKRFSGLQPVHTVSVGKRKLQVTANHPFYSYSYDGDAPKKLGRYRLAYVRADHLQEAIVPRTSIEYGAPHQLIAPDLVTRFDSMNQYADGLVMSRMRASRMTANEYTTDSLMWLFGYWVGDGDIEVKAGKTADVVRYAKVGFSTPATDRARERLTMTMATLVATPPTERADGNHLAWSNKELAEFFMLNGFTGKATSKRVPQWVWSTPESQRLAFIAGHLDADGSVTRGQFSLKSANRELLEDIASLLVTLGITSRLHTEFEEPRQVEIMGVMCIAHASHRLVFVADPRLLPHVSAMLRMQAEREAPTIQMHRQVGRSSIELPQSVECVDVDVSAPTAEALPTWDIEVEGTGNFVSQGFIVHNSKLTMKYPAVWLMEPHARGEVLSVAFAGDGQHQDAGGKVVHVAPHTSSQIVSKSISKGHGRSSYRGLLKVHKGANDVRSNVRCDALLLDETSRTDTYPYIEIEEEDVEVGHEATVSKVGEEQLFYLMSRGLSESEAYTMIVSGFIEPIAKELPLEYAVELNRLIQLEMSGSVG
jgi:Fe-S cluster assembly protein SufB